MNLERHAVIPMEEYDRLKQIEKVFDEVVKDRKSVVKVKSYTIGHGGDHTYYYEVITEEAATNLFKKEIDDLTENRNMWWRKALDLEAEIKTIKEKSFWKQIFG